MGISGRLCHLPLPSGTEPAVLNVTVEIRDGLAGGMENTSATNSAGNVVGDDIRVAEIAGGPIFSWSSTSRTRYVTEIPEIQ